MFTELLGLAGSGVLGAIFGGITDVVQQAQERKSKQLELEHMREARLHNITVDYLSNDKSFASSPAYAFCFGLLCFTYCACTVLCFYYPDISIWTFNPDSEPAKYSVLWGLFEWSYKTNHVYTISTGGVGYGLLHPLAFQIGTVITGINPAKK